MFDVYRSCHYLQALAWPRHIVAASRLQLVTPAIISSAPLTDLWKKHMGGSPSGKRVEAPQALTRNTNTGVRIDPPGAQIDGDSGGQKIIGRVEPPANLKELSYLITPCLSVPPSAAAHSLPLVPVSRRVRSFRTLSHPHRDDYYCLYQRNLDSLLFSNYIKYTWTQCFHWIIILFCLS